MQRYTDCMTGGNRKDHDCREFRLDLEAKTNLVLEVIYFISVAFLNFASLPFVVQFQAIKNFIRQAAMKLKCSTKTNS